MEDQRRLLAEAQRSLEAAELLAANGFWGYAASRGYYAMLYVAEALLLEKNLSFRRHSAVIAAFGQHFAKTGELPQELHKHLVEAMELRQAGDYGSGLVVTEERARLQLSRAREFLRAAEQRLRSP